MPSSALAHFILTLSSKSKTSNFFLILSQVWFLRTSNLAIFSLRGAGTGVHGRLLQYLFSDEKMKAITPHITDYRYVKQYAEENHVHPSIVYTFYNWDNSDDKRLYAKFDKYMPNFDSLLERFNTEAFLNFAPIKQISNQRNLDIYTI